MKKFIVLLFIICLLILTSSVSASLDYEESFSENSDYQKYNKNGIEIYYKTVGLCDPDSNPLEFNCDDVVIVNSSSSEKEKRMTEVAFLKFFQTGQTDFKFIFKDGEIISVE